MSDKINPAHYKDIVSLSSFKRWDEEDKIDVWDNTNPEVVDNMTHIAKQIAVALANRYDVDSHHFPKMVAKDSWKVAEAILIQREEWINE